MYITIVLNIQTLVLKENTLTTVKLYSISTAIWSTVLEKFVFFKYFSFIVFRLTWQPKWFGYHNSILYCLLSISN